MLEKILGEKQAKAISELRGLRKMEVDEVFERLLYLGPEDFKISNFKKSKPVASFNPGALLEGDRLLLFPRLIFDYYKYVSSVGLAELDMNDVLEGTVETPLGTRIILWPQKLWEFLGSEDPRVFKQGDDVYILYTGKGYYIEGGEYRRRDVLALAKFYASWKLAGKGYFSIVGDKGIFVPVSNKDSAFIEMKNNESTILTRPEIEGIRVCWRGKANLREMGIYEESLEPVLVHEKWELKVGWSTNVVKVSSNEYLVGWHGVMLEDYSYRNGLALVDSEGKLLAVSNYLLSPRGLIEEYGDRALVIFGDGLLKYKELLLWVGGVSDYAIGVFAVELDRVYEKLKWLKG